MAMVREGEHTDEDLLMASEAGATSDDSFGE